jgi:hypothetical protein
LEGKLHWVLKETVARELKADGYRVYVEPPESPDERLAWSLYRPDVLGIASADDESRFVVVECETAPSASRVRGKTLKIRSLTLQKRLNEKHVFRFILIILPGLLTRALYPDTRRLWEIWIVNPAGEVCHRIPQNK